MPRFLRRYFPAKTVLVSTILLGLMSLPDAASRWTNLRPTVAAETASNFVVNSNGDGADSNVGDGICDNGSGVCTLRAAIQESNANGTDDVINFPLSLIGTTITLNTALPAISGNLILTGLGSTAMTVQRSTAGGTPDFRIFTINANYTVFISGLKISNGNATADFPGNIGGAVLNQGTMVLNECLVTGNSAAGGGGVFNRGTMLIANSTIRQNTSSGSGGGISNSTGDDQSSTLRINNSTISNNISQSGGGGGISNIGHVFITNTTISGNSGANGGGINNSNPMRLTNVTVTGNTGSNAGGGIYNPGIGTISFGNTIIAGNTSPSGPDGNGFNFSSLDYNLIGNTSQINTTGITAHNITNVNALLASLGNYGGPTQTHALLLSSPAIDAGNNCVLNNSCSPSLEAPLETDQRLSGFPRGADGNGDGNVTVDIGAFEVRAAVVTNVLDAGAGSLRQAINDANAGTSVITFQPGVSGTISLLSALPDITASISIIGPGANVLTVQRSTAGGTPAFRIFAITAGQTVSISGLTISNGSAGSGAGIHNRGALTLNACAITGNAASVAGGALTNDGQNGSASVTIRNSTISGNTAASFGAGLFNTGFNGSASLNIINSTIADNGEASFGGGIYNSGDSGNIVLSIINCTIAGNRAGSSGGGIFHSGNNGAPTLSVWNTIVSDNTIPSAPANGPDILNSNGIVVGSNNLIETTTGYTITGANNLHVDPRLEKDLTGKPLLRFDGGPTQTLALLAGSAAFDAGDNAQVNNPPLTTDQRGNGYARVVDGPDADTTPVVDIGAFEAQVSVTDIADQVMNEDGSLSVPFNVGGPITSVTATSSNTALVPNNPANISVSGSGSGRTLVINPAANAFGTSTITVTVDSLITHSMTDTFVLTVNPVNDPPSFTRGFNQTANENDGAQTVNNWATNISAGPNESGQNLTFIVTANDNPLLFAAGPAIDSNGTLTYTPNTGISGSATITIVLKDDGGGADTSAPQSFVISVVDGGTLGFNAENYSVAEIAGSATITISRSVGIAGTATVLFTTSNGTATAADYTSVSQTVTFNQGEVSKTVNVPIIDDSDKEPNETINLTLSNAGGSGQLGFRTTAVLTILDDDPADGVRFSSANYNTTENSGSTTIAVERFGDTTAAVTVDYRTEDGLVFVPCANVNGVAARRCDYTTAVGTLRFAAGETSKTFAVLISQDNYVEGPETLALRLLNPTGGVALAGPWSTTLTIADDVTEPATNPIDVAESFVRQHYHDFLNREPDAAGLAFWSNQITECQQPGATCNADERRINVSAAFFLSIEFQETGYLVERLYKSAYGDAIGTSNFGPTHELAVPVIRFHEFLPDTQQIGKEVVVGVGDWEAKIEANKVAFIQEFVLRSRFTTAFTTALTPAQFVDALFLNAGVTPSTAERDAAIAEFGGAVNTVDAAARARVLRRVAENATLAAQEKNKAFVLMQYFGYLRRDPNEAPDTDYSGYDFWLTKLNQFNGNFVEAEMVKAFIISGEYRARFGP